MRKIWYNLCTKKKVEGFRISFIGGSMKTFLNFKDKTRQQLLKTSAYYGLISNFILFCSKLIVGLLSGSISIISDAFNNLLDFSNSIITLVTTFFASKPADDSHPFGHGRVEYISTQFVSFFILYVGITLLLKSIEQIRTAQAIQFNMWLYAVLILSFIVKASMVLYNKKITSVIHSDLIDAVIIDSKMDVISSIILLVALSLQRFVSLPIDGVAGLILSVILIYQGIGILGKTLSKLLGKSLSEEMISDIDKIINQHHHILGYHNLKGHDYGPNHIHVSVDIELPDTTNLVDAHRIVDEIERQLNNELNIDAVCHIDPISTDEQLNQELLHVVLDVGKGYFELEDITKFACVRGHLRTSVFITLDSKKNPQFGDNKERFLKKAKKETPYLSFHVILA